MTYSRFRGQAAPSKELTTLLERQARWDEAGGPGEMNPSKLRLRFQKIDDQVTPGGRVAMRYRVYADGAPENKVFSFTSWPMAKPFSPDPRDIYVNGQGLLLLHKPSPEQEMAFKSEDELEVTPITGIAEPMRYLLARRDGQLQIFGTLVPDPVVSEEQGCRLEVRIAQPDAAAALIIIDGFPVKAKISLVLESEGAGSSEVLTTNLDGHAVLADFPFVPGKKQGVLKVSAEGPNCLPSVLLPWGSAGTLLTPTTPAAPVTPPAAPATAPASTTPKTMLERLRIRRSAEPPPASAAPGAPAAPVAPSAPTPPPSTASPAPVTPPAATTPPASSTAAPPTTQTAPPAPSAPTPAPDPTTPKTP
ncbi:MAG: hypothetical protein ABSE51_06225 [Terracidiphilus sp.]